MMSFEHVTSVFKLADEKYEVFSLSENYSFIVPLAGGHFLGPFCHKTGKSLFWLNCDALSTADSLRNFRGNGGWNLGGERLWLSPEIRFGIRNELDYWGSLFVSSDIDPGLYSSATTEGSLELTLVAGLDTFNPPMGKVKYKVIRQLTRSPNPLLTIPQTKELTNRVEYIGYSHDARLREIGGGAVAAEPWSLVQLIPNGEIIFPISECLDYEDYYEPIDGDYYSAFGNTARIRITGDRRYKIGVRSRCHFGRVGYVTEFGECQCLVIRNFYNDPSESYAERPAERPECKGLSLHFYNDGGMFGGFGEMESTGRPVGGGSGRIEGWDTFNTWIFLGEAEDIRQIGRMLLGVDR